MNWIHPLLAASSFNILILGNNNMKNLTALALVLALAAPVSFAQAADKAAAPAVEAAAPATDAAAPAAKAEVKKAKKAKKHAKKAKKAEVKAEEAKTEEAK